MRVGISRTETETEKGHKVRDRRGWESERKTDMTFDTVTVYLAGG